jgi:hypothetical protein
VRTEVAAVHDERVVKGTYIQFTVTQIRNRKTTTWAVSNSSNGSFLGHVAWYGPWRKYAYFPDEVVLEETCMREIADFAVERTKEVRSTWKRKGS